jgi:hypothetical protein
MEKPMETVCGYSCSGCDHYGNECSGCEKSGGKPFWISYVGIDQCQIYTCCHTERHLPHCGKCPDLMCERFTRFRDPEMSDEEAKKCLDRMEKELRSRP